MMDLFIYLPEKQINRVRTSDSLPKRLQCPWLSQVRAKIQELFILFSGMGGRDLRAWATFHCFPGCISKVVFLYALRPFNICIFST